MDHALPVGVFDGLDDGGSSSAASLGGTAFGQPSGQALAVDESHREVVLSLVLADLENRHDARMVEKWPLLGPRNETDRGRPWWPAVPRGSSSPPPRGSARAGGPYRPRPSRRGRSLPAIHSRRHSGCGPAGPPPAPRPSWARRFPPFQGGRGLDDLGLPERLGEAIHFFLIPRRTHALAGQVGMPAQQFLPIGLLPRVDGLQIGLQDR